MLSDLVRLKMKHKNFATKHLSSLNRLFLFGILAFGLFFAGTLAVTADAVSANESEQIAHPENTTSGAQTISISEDGSPPWWMPNIVIPLVMFSAAIIAAIILLAISAVISFFFQNRRPATV